MKSSDAIRKRAAAARVEFGAVGFWKLALGLIVLLMYTFRQLKHIEKSRQYTCGFIGDSNRGSPPDTSWKELLRGFPFLVALIQTHETRLNYLRQHVSDCISRMSREAEI